MTENGIEIQALYATHATDFFSAQPFERHDAQGDQKQGRDTRILAHGLISEYLQHNTGFYDIFSLGARSLLRPQDERCTANTVIITCVHTPRDV